MDCVREPDEVRCRDSSKVIGRGEDSTDASCCLRGAGGGPSSSTLDGGDGGEGPTFESALPSRCSLRWKVGRRGRATHRLFSAGESKGVDGVDRVGIGRGRVHRRLRRAKRGCQVRGV